MSVVKICHFGQLSVECNEKVWTGPEGDKSRELFCYLLIRRNVHHNRGPVEEISQKGSDGKQLVITVSVDADAAIGPRDLRLINPDCSTAITQITVSGQTLASGPTPRPESRPQRVAAIETPSKKAASKKRRG
jgi:hypothetical protein